MDRQAAGFGIVSEAADYAEGHARLNALPPRAFPTVIPIAAKGRPQ